MRMRRALGNGLARRKPPEPFPSRQLCSNLTIETLEEGSKYAQS